MNAARWRLLVLVLVLAAGLTIFGLTDLVDANALRARVAATGPWAPLVYVVVSAVLGAVLVPGPLLAGMAGVLFGPIVGTVVTISSSVLSALLALVGGRRVGRAGVMDLLGERAVGFVGLAKRYGTMAVVAERLAPGVPDAPTSWAFGAMGLSARQIGVGTAIGASPRAFSYAAIGASLQHPGSAWGIAAIVVYILTAIVGAEGARRMLRTARRQRRSAAAPAAAPAAGSTVGTTIPASAHAGDRDRS